MRFDLSHIGAPAWKGTRTTFARGRERTVMRHPKEVTHLVVHQTATRLPPSRRLVERHGYEQAAAVRAQRVNAHAVAMRTGDVVLARPVLAYVHHANAANRCSVGLEVEGRYPGRLDDPATAPREDLLSTWGLRKGQQPDQLDASTRLAIVDAVALLYEEVTRAGGRLRYVVAHRQSNPRRRNDPGEEVWRFTVDVARVHGLVPLAATTWGKGRPLPEVWGGVKGERL